MALKWAGSRVSMSVSHATTRVRLSCAADRSGGKAAPPSAAAPAVTFRNDRRSIRLLMLGLLSVAGVTLHPRRIAGRHRSRHRPPRVTPAQADERQISPSSSFALADMSWADLGAQTDSCPAGD